MASAVNDDVGDSIVPNRAWCSPVVAFTIDNEAVCDIKREHTQDGAGGRLAGRRAGVCGESPEMV